MTALEQKLNDYQIKLAQLKAEKAAEIEKKVQQYQLQLEKEMDHSDEAKILVVIDALQKVIDFEAESVKPATFKNIFGQIKAE